MAQNIKLIISLKMIKFWDGIFKGLGMGINSIVVMS